jgi:hypothetical protein
MKRVALAVFAIGALTAPGAAQLGGGVPKCERDYQQFFTRLSDGAAKDLSGAQLAQINRYALRAYDGCTAGDERFVGESFFKKLEAIDPAKAEEFLRDLEKSIPAKR